MILALLLLLTGCEWCDTYDNMERRYGVEMSEKCPWPFFLPDGTRGYVCFKEGCG